MTEKKPRSWTDGLKDPAVKATARIVGGIAITAGGIGTLAVLDRQGAPAHEVVTQEAPANYSPRALVFDRVDQNGQPFSDADLAGKTYMASFFLTGCTDICPQLMANLNTIQTEVTRRTKDEPWLRDYVALVAFSTDPGRDRVDTKINPPETGYNETGIRQWFKSMTGRNPDDLIDGETPVTLKLLTVKEEDLNRLGVVPGQLFANDNMKLAWIDTGNVDPENHSENLFRINGDTRDKIIDTRNGVLEKINGSDLSKVGEIIDMMLDDARERYNNREQGNAPDNVEQAERLVQQHRVKTFGFGRG